MTPVFTAEQVRDDAKTRVAKTAGQSGAALALVTVLTWAAHQAGWHGEMPLDVQGGLVVLLTTIGAYVTNLARIRAK